MTVVGRQAFGHDGVFHDLADLGADEFGRRIVGLAIEEQVAEGPQEGEASVLPTVLVDEDPLLGLCGQSQCLVAGDARSEGEGHLTVALPKSGVVGLDRLLLLVGQGTVVGGHRIGGGALEDDELARLLGNDRDRLDAGGAGADDSHPLSGEVDGIVGPPAGVERGAGEAVSSRGSPGCWPTRGSRSP